MRSLAAEQRQPLSIGGAYPQPPTAGQLPPGRPGPVGLHTISPGMVLTNLLLEGSTFANRQVQACLPFPFPVFLYSPHISQRQEFCSGSTYSYQLAANSHTFYWIVGVDCSASVTPAFLFFVNVPSGDVLKQ